MGHRKLIFDCTLPKIYFDQNKTTEDNDIAMEFIDFDWHLQGYTNNGSHSKLNTDRHSNFINMIFHNKKVQLSLYIFPKSQVLATKTFGVREVQSWRTILTVKIGYTLCVKTRFWVLLWNAWEFKSFNGIPFKLSGSLEHKLSLLGAQFSIYLR